MIDLIYSDEFAWGFLGGHIFGMCCTFVIVILGMVVEKDDRLKKSKKEESDTVIEPQGGLDD